MKLLFLANARVPSERAMGTAIMKQCEAFAKKGIDVELVVPRRTNVRTEDPFVFHDAAKCFTITFLPCLDFKFLGSTTLRFVIQKMSFIFSLTRYCVRNQSAVLYTREPELLVLSTLQKRAYVELHHLYGLRWGGRRLLRKCVGVITITHALQEDIVERYGIDANRIHVAPSGIDIAGCTSTAEKSTTRKLYSIPSDAYVALYAGSFEEWKGYRTFLEASTLLGLEIACVVVGGAADQIKILRKTYPRVRFLGTLHKKELPNLYAAADVLIAPNSARTRISARHTSPLKVLEYMVNGVPIVASNTVALRELLNPENAFLCEPDNADALATTIRMVQKDQDAAKKRAQRAQTDVQSYSWDIRTDRLLHYMKTV